MEGAFWKIHAICIESFKMDFIDTFPDLHFVWSTSRNISVEFFKNNHFYFVFIIILATWHNFQAIKTSFPSVDIAYFKEWGEGSEVQAEIS